MRRAGPPVRPAAAPEAWTGRREAPAWGPVAPQVVADYSRFVPPELLALGGFGGGRTPPPQDEECLTLNGWTPGLDDGERPVMVWQHGGPFDTGTNHGHDGSTLARSQDVVVVTVNHRPGALGFLHLEGVAPGRYPGAGSIGVQDLVTALEWVRDNIAAFGGDPGNVTVFGCSGGVPTTGTRPEKYEVARP